MGKSTKEHAAACERESVSLTELDGWRKIAAVLGRHTAGAA